MGLGRPFLPEEDQLIRDAIARGESSSDAARRLDRAPISIRQRAIRIGAGLFERRAPETEGKKRCPTCGVWKPLGEFHASSDRKDGRQSTCIKCKARKRAARSKERNERLRAEAVAHLGETQVCRVCFVEKTIDEFARSPKARTGFSTKCLSCIADDARKPNAKTREKDYRRRRAIERTYGIPYGQFLAMLQSQNYVCAICKEPETKTSIDHVTSLCVDHDHDTGFVRGLLCRKCNAALGQFGDRIDNIRSAERYLKRAALAQAHKPALGITPDLFGDVA